MQPSFQEKSVWIQFVAILMALGAYFVVAAIMLGKGITELGTYVPLFAGATVILVILQVFGHTIAAVLGKPEPRDERDRIIGWRAESNSAWILGVGVLAGITAMVLKLDAVWIAHGLLLSLFVSQVACYLFQLVYYRRGMSGVGGV